MDTTLSPITVQIIVSMLIPIVIGLLTKSTLPGSVKAVGLLIANSVAALIIAATVDGGGAVISQTTFFQWAIGLAIAVASYFGVYEPMRLTSKPDGVLAPNVGIGPVTHDHDHDHDHHSTGE